MAKPIDYHYVAVIQKWGKFIIMDGQSAPKLTYVSTHWRFFLQDDQPAIFKLTLTDKEGGIEYAYAHNKFEPLEIPIELAKRLIESRRLGFFPTARETAKPLLTSYEIKTYIFDPEDYCQVPSKEPVDSLEKKAIETQRSIIRAFNELLKDRPLTYDQARTLTYVGPRALTELESLRSMVENVAK